MKKAYKKPVLLVECFTLSQTIAHNCGENLDFSMGTLKTKAIAAPKTKGEIKFHIELNSFPTRAVSNTSQAKTMLPAISTNSFRNNFLSIYIDIPPFPPV